MWSYPLVAITPRSALARSSSTCPGPSYGLNNNCMGEADPLALCGSCLGEGHSNRKATTRGPRCHRPGLPGHGR